MTLDDSVLRFCSSGVTVHAEDSTLQVIDSDVMADIGGIAATEADIVISGSTIVHSATAGYGVGLLTGGSTLDMAGGAIASNAREGVLMLGGPSAIVRGTAEIRDNGAGGIDALEGGSVVVGGTAQIHGNTGALGAGITIGMGGTAVVRSRAQVRDNTSTGDGGGIAATGGAAVLLASRARVRRNRAAGDGGGIWVDAGGLTLFDNARITANRADGEGGGVAARDALVTVDPRQDGRAIRISRNRAGTHGGGFALRGTSLDVFPRGATLIGAPLDGAGDPVAGAGNIARGEGGGIYAVDSAVMAAFVTLEAAAAWTIPLVGQAPVGCAIADNIPCATVGGVRVVGNQAVTYGGGLRLIDTDLQTRAAVIAKNTVRSPNTATVGFGGGIAASGVGHLEMLDTTVFQNDANRAGGLFLEGPGLTAELFSDFEAQEGLCARAEVTNTAPFDRETDRFCAEVAFNSAVEAGGALLQGGASLTATNAAVFGNSTVLEGAALIVEGGSSVTLHGVLLARQQSTLGDTAVWIRSSATLTSMSSTYGAQPLQVRYEPGTSGSFDANIVWDADLANQTGADVLSAPPGAIPGSCNMGLGVRHLSGAGNLERVDPLFVSIPETDFFLDPASDGVDACAVGPIVDLIGVGRPIGDFDMGAFEQ